MINKVEKLKLTFNCECHVASLAALFELLQLLIVVSKCLPVKRKLLSSDNLENWPLHSQVFID